MANDLLATIRKLATRHPNVTRGVACAGTELESTTYNVNDKAFLFVRPNELRLKRKTGWVKVALAGTLPAQLGDWIAESYGLMTPIRKAAARASGGAAPTAAGSPARARSRAAPRRARR